MPKVKYHIDSIFGDFRELLKDFSFSGRISVRCSKAALAACIAYMLSLELELQSNYWAPFTCMIMLTPYLGTTIEKGIYRIGGTLIGAILAFIIFGFTIQNQLYYTIYVFIVAAFCYYMHANSKYRGYFWFMINQAFVLISTVGFGNIISPADFATVAFDRAANLMIGVVVYTVINLLIMPDYASNELDGKLKKLRAEVKKLTESIFEQYLNSKFNKKDIYDQYSALKVLIKSIETVSHYAYFEKKLELKSLNYTFIDYVRVAEYLDELVNFYHSINALGYSSYQSNHAKQIRKILEYIKAEPDLRKVKAINEERKKINEQFSIINTRYIKRYERGKLLNYSTSEIYLFHESMITLKDYISFYFTEETPMQLEELPANKATEEIYDEFLGFKEYNILGYKLFIHTPYLQFAVRTAITLVAVIWGWKLLGLPTDMSASNVTMAVMTTCVPDYVSSHHKGLLRFLGCSAGFLIGWLLLGFSIESTPVLMIWIFIVGYFAGRVQCAGAGISYMGLQAFLAFCVALIPEWGPVTNAEEVFLRFIGIFFGVIAMWLISAVLWKVEYFSIIKRGIFFFWEKFKNFNVFHADELSPDILLNGINLIRGNISKVGITTDIPSNEQTLLKNWCNTVDRLLFVVKSIISSPLESKEFINSINPEIIDRVDEMCSRFSVPKNQDEPEVCLYKILEILSMIENLKQEIRSKHLFHDKSMEFRQETMKFITSLKRLANRIRDINRIHGELYECFVNNQRIKT